MVKIRLRPDAVREAALRGNQTLNEFALHVGLQPSHLHALMRGDYGPSARIRRRLLTVLSLEFEQLFEISKSEIL